MANINTQHPLHSKLGQWITLPQHENDLSTGGLIDRWRVLEITEDFVKFESFYMEVNELNVESAGQGEWKRIFKTCLLQSLPIFYEEEDYCDMEQIRLMMNSGDKTSIPKNISDMIGMMDIYADLEDENL